MTFAASPTLAPAGVPPAGAAQSTGPAGALAAVRGALEQAGPDGSPLVALFCGAEVDPAAAAIHSAQGADGVPVAGMTGQAVLGAGGVVTDGCVALALPADLSVGVGVRGAASLALRASAAAAVEEALDELGGVPSLVMLFLDTRSGDQADAIAGAYDVAGPRVPLAGGAAGGARPAQLARGRAHADTVVAVALGAAAPVAVGVAQGSRTLGPPSIVTAVDGRTVAALDGRPAEAVYLERLGTGGARLDDRELSRLAALHPLAQLELRGDVRLRHVLGRAPGGGLRCATAIPPNAPVQVTAQSPDDVVQTAGEAAGRAAAGLGRAPVRAALAFDCAGRLGVLSSEHARGREADAIRQGLGTPCPPLAGLYTRGEVGRARGAKGDRNHALVVAALA